MILKNIWSLLSYGVLLREIKLPELIINASILLYSIFHVEEMYRSNSIWLFILLVFISVLWQFLSTIKSIVKLFRYPNYYYDNEYLINLNDVRISEDVEKHYNKRIIDQNYQLFAIYSDKINAYLHEGNPITVNEVNEKKTVLHDYIEQEKDKSFLFLKTKWHQNKKVYFFNDKKLCMISELLETNSENVIKVCKGYYYNSFVTNDIFCKRLCHNNNSYYVQPPLNPYNQQITSLSRDTSFSNHIGVSMMLLTIDGFIIVLKHNSRTAVSPNLYQPTCSGSGDYDDWSALKKNHEYTLEALIKRMMLRELFEETNIREEQIESIEQIGFFRNIIRGGKPEFCGLAHSSLTNDQARNLFIPDRKEMNNSVESIRIIEGDNYVISHFSDFIKKHRRTISAPLYMTYIFLDDIIKKK